MSVRKSGGSGPPFAASAVVVAAAAVLAAGVSSLLALEMPNLSGKWHLNRDASDSADSLTRDGSAAGRSGGGGYRGHGGMGHGGGGHHGRPAGSDADGDGASGRDDSGSLRDALARAQELDIRHAEPQLSITDATGRERLVYTDGRKTEEEHSTGGTTAVHARWKDGRIEVTSVPEKGPKVIETYSVTADHTQLMVTTTFERRQGGEVSIHRVYDAVPENVAPPPAAPPPPEPDPDPAVSAR